MKAATALLVTELLVTDLVLAPSIGHAATVYLRCDFAGSIQTNMTFEVETKGDSISGISVAAPNWGTMQLDTASSGQLIAHMKRGISSHPDAVLTLIANRLTGHATLFYSPPIANPLELYIEGTPYQKGEGKCQKAERAF